MQIAKEIREKKTPPDIKNLLSDARTMLNRHGKLEMIGYEFDASTGLKPFYGLYVAVSSIPLITVMMDSDKHLRLTLNYRLSQGERESITGRAEEFSRKHGYTLRI